MGCKNCGPTLYGICRCCELIDKDTTTKKVYECKTCDANICGKCNNNYPKRALAFGLNIIDKLTSK